MSQVWINGQANARLDGLDRGLAYGDGLFATMRVQHGKILFLSAHLARLRIGAARLGFDWLASDALLAQFKALVSEHQAACIKLVLSRGVGGRGYGAPEHPSVTEIVSLHPMPAHYAHWQQFGVSLKSSAVQLARQPRLAGVKHLNRLEQVLIKSAPLTQGFDDWLVFDAEGGVIGASMANIFLVKGKQVYTPSMAYSGISGVMREHVIFALTELGFDIEVAPLHYTQLTDFDHGFMAQQDVYLNFDIITLTFEKDEVYHVIPVVSNPIDILGDFDPPPFLDNAFSWDWVIMVLIIIGLVILLVVLSPVLPLIFSFIIN